MSTIINITIAFLLYSVLGTMEIDQHVDTGIKYQCGHVIFTNQMVQEALEVAFKHLEKGSRFPIPYGGLLYSSDSGYYLWPLKKHGQVFQIGKEHPSSHFLVMNREKEVIDVVIRLTDYDFMKCSKFDPSLPDSSESIMKDSNGYQCGHVFFSDKRIIKSQELAINKLGMPGLIYPSLIDSPLYEGEHDYMIWPIWKRRRIYRSGKEISGPFYIVIDSKGELIDVIARAADKSYIKCTRNKMAASASPHDPFSKLFVPPPISGFDCGKAFFDDKYIERAVSTAQLNADLKLRKKVQFPEKFDKDPFGPGTLVWPLSVNGKLRMRGNGGLFRLVLSETFEPLGVIIMKNKQVHVCEKITIKGRKDLVTNDFSCLSEEFSHEELRLAADLACEKRSIKTQNLYPAKYIGPDFDIVGPYLTYPVTKHGPFNRSINSLPLLLVKINSPYFQSLTKSKDAGKFRVVMTTKCEIAGALVKHEGIFYKCQKKADETPSDFTLNKPRPPIEECPM